MPSSEIPDWVTETPREMEYYLAMIPPDGSQWEQEIEISRAEFIELKAHLAKLRGYAAEGV